MTVITGVTATRAHALPDNTQSSYTVQRGDSLSAIAKHFGIGLDALKAANAQILNPNLIYPGDRISIPAGAQRGGSEPGTASSTADRTATTAAASGSKALTLADYQRAANALGVDVATVRAVAEVESAGNGFLADGRPKILFERHIFARETGHRYDASHPGISGPAGGYGAGGAHQHDRFAEAYALDPQAAMRSASWGEFQIMGFNHRAAGYGNVTDFVNAMRESSGKHLDAFVGFIKSNGLADEMQRHDWAGFARGYNGAGYARNQYDTKMAAAYARYSGSNPPPVENPPPNPGPNPGGNGNYTVRSGDTFGQIAADHRVSLQALRNANPQIANINRIYPGQTIHIPGRGGNNPAPTGGNYSVRSGDTFGEIATDHRVSLQALRNANPQIANINRIYPGQTIHIPGGSNNNPAPASGNYSVRSGDTFGEIAADHRVSLQALRNANPQIANINRIYPGQTIHIPGGSNNNPAPASGNYSVRSGDTFGEIAADHRVSLQALRNANPQIANINRIYPGQSIHIPGGGGNHPAPPPPQTSSYTVRSGDTFSGIADRHGMSTPQLRTLNPQIHNINLIYPGQTIHVKGGSGPGPVDPSPGTGSGQHAANIAHSHLGRWAGDLKRSGDLPMNPNVPNTVCCANFVSAVLQKAGLINFHTDLVTGSNWNAPNALGTLLKARGWHVVPASQARPGDVAIVNNGHHTELVYSNRNGNITLIGSNNTGGGSGPQRISYGNPYGNAWYLTPPR